MPTVLVVTGRDACCNLLTPDESLGLEQEIENSDPWLQSVASLKPEEYDAHVESIFKTHGSDDAIVVCTDAPPSLALKIAYTAGALQHQKIYIMYKDGSLAKV